MHTQQRILLSVYIETPRGTNDYQARHDLRMSTLASWHTYSCVAVVDYVYICVGNMTCKNIMSGMMASFILYNQDAAEATMLDSCTKQHI